MALSDTCFDCLIVGGGFAGSVLAERLASQLGQRVLLIDRRSHIGGNAYDCLDGAGVLVHRYGPHIFHTNAQRVVDYLSQFTQWRPYEHRVLGAVDGQLVPIPINLTTLNRLYGLDLDEAGAAAFLAARATPLPAITSSRDVVVSQVGEELYEKFFAGYTRKQWGRDASQLDKSVTARVPTRTTADDRYFQDTFQCMPLHGYTQMFERMIDHPLITFWPSTEFAAVKGAVRYRHLVYCGPVDEYFGYRYGKLPYRSLRFEHQTLDQAQFQSVAVVNYPAPEVPFTRITEYKHLTGQQHPKTSITREFPTDTGDPYYPIPAPENAALYRRYEALAERTPGVTFTGRLGTYRYYNMDQVVAQSLALFSRIADKYTVGAVAARSGAPV
ncbi:UDP-galactopyranose mutase [Rhodococcus sp. SRB_17]|uniref:UDP-galactopyranose mutase n=1 Tax=Acidovorax sp. SRB_24 TaxID=1962700 RepID=UPI00145F290B|nr:UDP-galactopyranose mutase [Acidovorax sp. SRB_24]NMM78499.1 UDP-galactopyranose mutase [Acidovorax sp. SRB_24]NMM91197.1 UDP-galactopyranose mutase [Rhodococcus sp. SRB_17]